MKSLFNILFYFLLVSFCFSDMIIYLEEGYVKHKNAGEMTVVSDQKTVIKDVDIKSTLGGQIHYTKPVLTSTSVNSGGGLILLSGLMNLYIMNFYDALNPEDLKRLYNLSNAMLSLGGLLVLTNSTNYFNQDFYIDCERIIGLYDESRNTIDFDCP